jgi:DNA-binding response OmpR family regulator
MPATLNAKKSRSPAAKIPWGTIPPTLRILYITSRQRTGSWLAEAFAADSASEIILEQAIGTAAGLARLRDEVFDAILVSHVPGELDALDLIEGYRVGGADEPIIVLGMESEQEMAVLCYEAGADGYVCANTTTTRYLIWLLVRAVARHQLAQENRRLNQADQSRLAREHDEAQRLLEQERSLAADLKSLAAAGPPAFAQRPELPAALVAHYRELLRTYVIMGSGNLAGELARLAEWMVAAGLDATQTLELHLHALAELVHGLGTRSSRHVMSRADLLAMEIMAHLAEGYRRLHWELSHPPVQQMLSFEP